MRIRTYFLLFSVAVASSVIGFIQGGWGFAGNLFAEFSGMLVSIAVGFLLVDRIIENEARRKWDRISSHTIASINHYLDNIGFACMTDSFLMELDSSASKSESPLTFAESFRRYAEYVSANAEKLGSRHYEETIEIDPSLTCDIRGEPTPDGGYKHTARTQNHADRLYKQWLDERSSVSLYREMQPIFDRFRDVITPRVISFGYEPDLAAALVAIESADTEWRANIKLIEDDWGLPEEYAWKSAASLFDACADLAEVVDAIERRSTVNRRVPFKLLRRTSRRLIRKSDGPVTSDNDTISDQVGHV